MGRILITQLSFTLTIVYICEVLMEKPGSASSFPETALHSSGSIFREENAAKAPPGAAFGGLLREAGEG